MSHLQRALLTLLPLWPLNLASVCGSVSGQDVYDVTSLVQIRETVSLGVRHRQKQLPFNSLKNAASSNARPLQNSMLGSFEAASSAAQARGTGYPHQHMGPRQQPGMMSSTQEEGSQMQNQPQMGGVGYANQQSVASANQLLTAGSHMGGFAHSSFGSQRQNGNAYAYDSLPVPGSGVAQGFTTGMNGAPAGFVTGTAAAPTTNTMQPQTLSVMQPQTMNMIQPQMMNMVQPQAQPQRFQGGLAPVSSALQPDIIQLRPFQQLPANLQSPQLPQMQQELTSQMAPGLSPTAAQMFSGQLSEADLFKMQGEQQRQEAEARMQQNQALTKYMIQEDRSRKEAMKELKEWKAKDSTERKARHHAKKIKRLKKKQIKRLKKKQAEDEQWMEKHRSEMAMFGFGKAGNKGPRVRNSEDGGYTPAQFGANWRQYLPGIAKEFVGNKGKQASQAAPVPLPMALGKPMMQSVTQPGMLSAMSQIA